MEFTKRFPAFIVEMPVHGFLDQPQVLGVQVITVVGIA